MTATLQKWGNSQGIRLPKQILTELSIKENDLLTIVRVDNNIIIQKAKPHKTLQVRLESFYNKPLCEIKELNALFMDFNPQIGYEQQGRRPALVISNDLYNKFSNLTFVCPITSTNYHHPFHLLLNDKIKAHGSILCEQLKALDLTKRNAEYIENVPEEILDEVLDIIKGFL